MTTEVLIVLLVAVVTLIIYFRKYLRHFLLINSGKKQDFYRSLRNIIGFVPANLSLYQQAFRHHSVSKKIRSDFKNSNERLEYLGDSVLNTVVAEYLFTCFPYKDEGFLTEMRSKIVSRESLNSLAMQMGIDKLIRYDENVYNNMVSKKVIYGNALEALIGAVYLDCSYSRTRTFVSKRILTHIDIDRLEKTHINFKGKLLEWAQRCNRELNFELLEERMVRKQRMYKVAVVVDSKEISYGENFSKKKAEQIAAEMAYDHLELERAN